MSNEPAASSSEGSFCACGAHTFPSMIDGKGMRATGAESMGVERTRLLQNLSPVRLLHVYMWREREKSEVRRRGGGGEGGILGDEEGKLQPHNVGMVEGGLCGIGAKEVYRGKARART